MPYSSNSDLPESVRSRYSSNCQSVWRHTFNSVLEDYGDEHRAFASATGQANKCQEKKSMDLHTTAIEPRFKIFAPMLKASLSADGKRRLHGIASSTIKDRHGDTMALSALSDMERSANNNLTIFLNHEYKVPEDVAGYVERAEIRQHPQDGEIHDLLLDIVVNEVNQRAVDAWDAIQNGTQLGLSIGAMIPDGGATRDRQTGAYSIEHVELLETSLVGVPANPRSWVEYAVKSLNGVVTRSDGEVGLLLEEVGPELEGGEVYETAVIVGEDGAENIAVLRQVDTTEEVVPHPDDPPEDGEDPEEEEEVQVPEETKTAATVSISTPYADISIDTGNRGGGTTKTPAGEPSQEALLSAPETEDPEEIEDLGPFAGILPVKSDISDMDISAALEVLEPSVVASLRNSSELLKVLTRELTDTREALAERNAEYVALEAKASEVFTKTGQILDALSNTPVGRRAVIRDAGEQYSSLQSVYGEEFMHLLKRS